MKLRWIDIISYLVYLAFLGFGVIARLNNTLSYIALFLSLVCAVLWFVARWQLGSAFSVSAQAHQLVVFEDSASHLRIRHNGVPLRGSSARGLAGTDHLGLCDLDPGRTRPARGAGPGGSVRSRIYGLPQQNVVLARRGFTRAFQGILRQLV